MTSLLLSGGAMRSSNFTRNRIRFGFGFFSQVFWKRPRRLFRHTIIRYYWTIVFLHKERFNSNPYHRNVKETNPFKPQWIYQYYNASLGSCVKSRKGLMDTLQRKPLTFFMKDDSKFRKVKMILAADKLELVEEAVKQ